MENSEQLLVDSDLLGFKNSNTHHPMAQSTGLMVPAALVLSEPEAQLQLNLIINLVQSMS